MASIELDMAYEGDSPQATLDELEANYEVSALILQEHGPGGGWPVVDFEGPRANLEQMILEQWDDGSGDLSWLVARIQES